MNMRSSVPPKRDTRVHYQSRRWRGQGNQPIGRAVFGPSGSRIYRGDESRLSRDPTEPRGPVREG